MELRKESPVTITSILHFTTVCSLHAHGQLNTYIMIFYSISYIVYTVIVQS